METDKKYKLTDECITIGNKKLYRIEALKDFSNVKKGDKGGFIESEDNLSQIGDCWIYDDAEVYGNARVFENAKVYNDANIHGNAVVCGNAKVYGNAAVYSNAEIFSDATVISDSDYIIFKNWWSSGRCFTWTRSNNMWKVGCFYGTGEELIAKAYKDSDLSGKEYERVVKYVESILKDGNTTTIVNKIKQCLLKIVKKFNL